MKKFVIAATLLSLAAFSPVQAKEALSSFTHEGVDYTYTVKQISDNRRVIEGSATPGTSFRLVVSGGRVFGTSNGLPVSFRVKDAVSAADNATVTTTKIASR